MFWSKLLPWLRRGKQAPARRAPSLARLAVETLEDRLVPSTTATDIAYQAWRQQTFKVDDAAVLAPQASNSSVMTAATPTNISFGSLIGLPNVFTNTPYRGAGYSVAVIDTGIDYTNPNLGGGFGRRVIAGWDFVNNDADPMDDNGHGTHVAGIIGSSNATYSGIAPNVNLIALKVLDASGSGSFGNVESALQWVVANRAKYNIVAINLSLGAGNYTANPFTFLDDEFSALKSGGVFLAVAAGNSFYSNNSAVGLDFPAVDPFVVSVGAVYAGDFGPVAWASGARDNTTGPDRIASFSQRGAGLSLFAPGAIITSTYLNNTFKAMAGTSMASPVVAGASVLVHQALDALRLPANEDTILNVMKTTGANIFDGDDENDNVVNSGLAYKRLDLSAALNSLAKPANTAPVLSAIANATVTAGSVRVVPLSAIDPDGDALLYAARIVSAIPSQAYQLKQQLGLVYIGAYYQNFWGQNEKWLFSNVGWYCILPNGQLRHWAGSMNATLQASNLTASLDARFYADPSLLWNAKASNGLQPALTVSGNQLGIQAPAGIDGSFQVEVTASDGKLSSAQTFTLTVQPSSALQIAAVANQSVLAARSTSVTLNATNPKGGAVAYSAQAVGAFAAPPVALSIVGNQMTIQAAPDFAGTVDVKVAASNGVQNSVTTFRVTVAAAPGSFRVAGDFNGDHLQDVATLNNDGTWLMSFKRPDGSYVSQSWGAWNAPTNWAVLKSGDFNGDGKADILAFDKAGAIYIGLTTGSGFVPQFWTQWSAASAWTGLTVSDVNGDGLADFLGKNANGRWYAAISTGVSFRTQLWA